MHQPDTNSQGGLGMMRCCVYRLVGGFGPAAGPVRMHEPGTADRGRRSLIGLISPRRSHRSDDNG